MIPFLDLKSINAQYRNELVADCTRVIDSGWYITGNELKTFEENFANYCGTEYAIGVANGLDALILTLRAWKELGKLKDGDDMMHSERIAKQLNFLQCNPQFDLVSTSMISIKNSNEIIGTRTYFPKQVTKKDALLGQSGILHASILAKKAWCERNLYNELNALAEDHELWLSAAIKDDLKVGFLPEYLYYYREESSATKQKMLKGYNTQTQIISKYYQDILSESEYKLIMKKFAIKKSIVKLADAINMMHIILKRRSNLKVDDEIINEYLKQLAIIHKVDS